MLQHSAVDTFAHSKAYFAVAHRAHAKIHASYKEHVVLRQT